MKRVLWTLAVAILLFASGCAAPAATGVRSEQTKEFTETAFGLTFTYKEDGTIRNVTGDDRQKFPPEDIKLPYRLSGTLQAVHVSSFGQHVMLLIEGTHYVIVCNQSGNCKKYYLPH
jgi:hypothetical protein